MTPYRLKEIENLGLSEPPVRGAIQELVAEIKRLRSQLKLSKLVETKCWKCGQEMTEEMKTLSCGASALIVGCELAKYRGTYKIYLCHSCHGALYNSEAEGIL